jgi:hypothetical protein
MGGVIIFIIIVFFAIICIALACSDSSSAEGQGASSQNQDYIYSAKEYIELYNYCVRKRNAMCNQLAGMYGFPAQSLSRKIAKMDEVLDSTTQEYESPYITDDYTKWCRQLLSILDHDEKITVNYGKLNKPEDK